ncbi:MFS transporter [Serratia marcescens]|uniref:MFS transporter n=1 Tax=Serratia marcescens TaxID=615 RepID=UPI00398948B4
MKNTKIPRLVVMMYLQYFVQGAWNMTMGLVLSSVGLSAIIGDAYALLGIATLISPLFIGLIADRFIPSQKVMATLHLINAGVLLLVPQYIEVQNTTMILLLIFFVGLIFYPTTALANSISFRHINGVKLFPLIRVFGTFGFMSIGFLLGQLGLSGSTTTWYIASGSAALLGIYCLTLPNTPPKARQQSFTLRELLCLDALSLFKDKYFAIFMASTFVLMIPKTAYSAYIPVFLKSLGFDNAATMMQAGTVMEVLFMFILSAFLLRFGFKTAILLGAICWILRSLLLSYSSLHVDITYVLAALMLQGLCWDFFFTAGDIYVDSKAKPEIKAQAQSLRFIVSNGIGLFFASSVCGKIFNETVTFPSTSAEALPQWATFWLYPAAVAACVSLFFVVFFKDDTLRKKQAAAAPAKS